MIELYGFSGKIGSGKNYVSEKIFLPALPQKPTLVMAFADHFKVDACTKDKLAFNRVFITKDADSRRILQKRGTEEGRDKYGDDIWIQTVATWIQIYRDRGIQRFILTDVRFENEAEWIKSMGGKLFRIVSPTRTHDRMSEEALGPESYNQIKNHISETALDNYAKFDYIILNDPDFDVYAQVDFILKETDNS